MIDWSRLPALTQVVQSTWLELGFYPRTLAHVVFMPRVFAAKLPRQLKGETGHTYTGPVFFFAMNAVLAVCVARLTGGNGHALLSTELPTSLLGALLGNAVLLGFAGMVFGLARRRQYELMLIALLYGSAYYVPISAVLSPIVSPTSIWPHAHPTGALVSRPSWSVLLWYWASERPLRLGLVAILSLAWLLFLARVTSAMRSRAIRLVPAFQRFVAALVLLAIAEAIVQYAAFSGPYGDIGRFTSAMRGLANSGPNVDDVDSYEAGETLMRNIARCSDFPPGERYMARAFASALAVTRCEAAQQLASRLGEVQAPRMEGSARELWVHGREPARFETLLAKVADECRAPGSLVTDSYSVGMELEDDVRQLRRLRSAPGFPTADSQFWRGSPTYGMFIAPAGLYLCPFPQGTRWPPACRYAVHIGHDLPGGQQAVASYVVVEDNPMKRILSSNDKPKP